MSIHYTAETFALTKAAKKVMPVETKVGRSFDLPVRLHVATVALYLVFLAVMALTYQTREMIIPMAIFVIYIAMAFGVPAMWVRMKPDHPVKTLGWAGFSCNGINTFTGVMSARDATAQVLMLPVLILGWGVGIAIITAAVR
jgi:hypothetical protein